MYMKYRGIIMTAKVGQCLFEEAAISHYGASLCFFYLNPQESWHHHACHYPYTLGEALGLYCDSCLHSVPPQVYNEKRDPFAWSSPWKHLEAQYFLYIKFSVQLMQKQQRRDRESCLEMRSGWSRSYHLGKSKGLHKFLLLGIVGMQEFFLQLETVCVTCIFQMSLQ